MSSSYSVAESEWGGSPGSTIAAIGAVRLVAIVCRNHWIAEVNGYGARCRGKHEVLHRLRSEPTRHGFGVGVQRHAAGRIPYPSSRRPFLQMRQQWAEVRISLLWRTREVCKASGASRRSRKSARRPPIDQYLAKEPVRLRLDKGAGAARCLSALSLSSVCCSSNSTDHSPLTREPIVKLWDMQQALSGSRCGRSASVGDRGRRLSRAPDNRIGLPIR